MKFEEGTSGNPKGRPKKAKLFEDALRLQLLRPESDKLKLPDNARVLDKVALALIEEATEGSNRTRAAAEIRDTLDGKPAQAVEHSGVIATTHEEYLKQLDSLPDDADREDDKEAS